jgi:hypothetical protein
MLTSEPSQFRHLDVADLSDPQTVRLWGGPHSLEESATPIAVARLALQKAPPVSLPDYEMLEEVGRGGAAVVYKARQLSRDRLVALKLIEIVGRDDQAVARMHRFRAEAEAVGRLEHPNLIQVYEVGLCDGWAFLAMELVEGGSVAHKLSGTALPPREAAQLVEVLARAIHHAHERQIIHRDLKPSNVLLTIDQQPKIADFGVAKLLDHAFVQTQTGTVVGTPSYMAPEQARSTGRPIGPATDVYALGAMLFELLTGHVLFHGLTLLDTLELVCSQEPTPPSRLQAAVPRDLEVICLKCLQKEPDKRYLSAYALADDLRRFQLGEPIMARPIGVLARILRWCRRKPLVAGLTAALFLTAALGFGAVTLKWREARQAELLAWERQQQAEQAREEALSLTRWLLLDRALDLCEQGESGAGLLWLGRCLELCDPESSDKERILQTFLNSLEPEERDRLRQRLLQHD